MLELQDIPDLNEVRMLSADGQRVEDVPVVQVETGPRDYGTRSASPFMWGFGPSRGFNSEQAAAYLKE